MFNVDIPSWKLGLKIVLFVWVVTLRVGGLNPKLMPVNSYSQVFLGFAFAFYPFVLRSNGICFFFLDKGKKMLLFI